LVRAAVARSTSTACEHAALLEHIADLVILISLFSAGLRIRLAPWHRM
jgi:hypothetical protein